MSRGIRMVLACGIASVASMIAGCGALAGNPTTLYEFPGGDVGNPSAGLIADSKGNLYGTGGAAFELSPPASGSASWTFNVLRDFAGGNDGFNAVGGLVFDTAGNLYGTTEFGGNGTLCGEGSRGCGVVYKLSPPASGSGQWAETTLFSFNGGAEGAVPQTALTIDASGNLYGVTPSGGLHPGCCGVAFELSPPKSASGPWIQTILYKFTGGADGGMPMGPMTFDAKGNLYGTTNLGGLKTNGCCGVVYELSPPASGSGPWTETVLHTFSGPDGRYIQTNLALDPAGNIYGAAFGGAGHGSVCNIGCGAIFKLSPPAAVSTTWGYQQIYRFSGGTDPAGSNPNSVTYFNGKLYGVSEGGVEGDGTLFVLKPGPRPAAHWVVESSGAFTTGLGYGPRGPLIIDPAISGSATFYATTGGGTTSATLFGTIFSWTP